MKILLTGASGFVGRNLAQLLARDGHELVPLDRRHGVDMSGMKTPSDWRPWLEGVDIAINTVGIIGETRTQRFAALHTVAPRALFDACRAAGVRKVIQISALGADESAFSAYHRSKRAADDHLRGLDLDWFVLRPSLIYGRGGTSSALFMRLARLPVIPVIGDGRQGISPVHIADVAATVAACLKSPRARMSLDIVGSEVLEVVEWLQRLRLAQGLTRAPVVGIPLALALAGAHLGRALSPMLRPENIRMLDKGYDGDGRPWNGFLGRKATDFSPALLAADALEGLALRGEGS